MTCTHDLDLSIIPEEMRVGCADPDCKNGNYIFEPEDEDWGRHGWNPCNTCDGTTWDWPATLKALVERVDNGEDWRILANRGTERIVELTARITELEEGIVYQFEDADGAVRFLKRPEDYERLRSRLSRLEEAAREVSRECGQQTTALAALAAALKEEGAP